MFTLFMGKKLLMIQPRKRLSDSANQSDEHHRYEFRHVLQSCSVRTGCIRGEG